MNSNLTLGSLFDGSGGFPLGGILNGITPIWASEIEPFPIRVTTKRIPNMKHLGDISLINGADIEPVDIITFGSPCTDMSIAGKRAGLGGQQSVLFYEAIRIIKEMRSKTNGKYPRFIVWENVTGAFSSNKGEDFRAVLKAICSIKNETLDVPKPQKGKWNNAGSIMGDDFSVAWRVFDAQYWGVPQRRRRIYLVADFTDKCARKVLFEFESMPGYSEESRSSWKRASSITENRIDTSINDKIAAGFCTEHSAKSRSIGYEKEKSPTLRSGVVPAVNLLFENHSQDTRFNGPLITAPTVTSTYGTGGNTQPFVVGKNGTTNIKNYDIRVTSEGTKNTRFNIYETQTARTLDTAGNHPDANQGGVAVIEEKHQHAVAFAQTYATLTANEGPKGPSSQMLRNPEQNFVLEPSYGIGRPAMSQGYNASFSFQVEEEIEPTIVASGASGVAQPVYSSSKASFFTSTEEELANTLVATDYKDPPVVNDKLSYGFYPQMKAECVTLTEEKSGCLVNGTNPGYQNGVVEPTYIVRRLTPTECARLQGFPDWWCADLETAEPTVEDIAYWKEIFSNYAKAIGKKIKPKTDKQIKKWLKNPHSDSAEYKMWGNGVALPNVCYVLSGIAYYGTNTEIQ